VAIKITGLKHWPWRAVGQIETVLEVLAQSRRDKRAAKRLLRKLPKRQCRAPRAMVPDKLPSYGAAKREVIPGIEHRQHKGPEQLAGELTPANATKREVGSVRLDSRNPLQPVRRANAARSSSDRLRQSECHESGREGQADHALHTFGCEIELDRGIELP
jgi:hypothetical protein